MGPKNRVSCPRQRGHAEIEVVEIVLGAGAFGQRPALYQAEPLDRGPWRGKRAPVFDRDQDLDGFSLIEDLVALDDVQRLGVRRAVIVDEASEIRFLRFRARYGIEIEEVFVVLVAVNFHEWFLLAHPTLPRGPFRREGAGVLDLD